MLLFFGRLENRNWYVKDSLCFKQKKRKEKGFSKYLPLSLEVRDLQTGQFSAYMSWRSPSTIYIPLKTNTTVGESEVQKTGFSRGQAKSFILL